MVHRPIDILCQPDDTTCGPTCLHAVYRFHGDAIGLGEVIDAIEPLPSGGTMAVNLACHALARGYKATIYTYNLHIFDPTWFSSGEAHPEPEMMARLEAQIAEKPADLKLGLATSDYLRFFELGGKLCYRVLDRNFLAELLTHERPILTGLSSTYLYGCSRELDDKYNDIGGLPGGHFVVLCDYDRVSETVEVADPLSDNPLHAAHHYRVGVDHLMGAIMLGIVTYDANLLIVEAG